MKYASTYVARHDALWTAATEPVDAREGLLRAAWRLWRHDGPAILNGAVPARRGYLDLFAAGVFQRRGVAVVISDTTWEPGSRKLDRLLRLRTEPHGYDAAPIDRPLVRRALMRLIDGPTVHYAAFSTDELETLPAVWGMSPQRVHFIPFCATAAQDEVSPGGGGVFAGGNSLRDYRALDHAAPAIRGSVTVATALQPPTNPHARFTHMSRAEYDAAAMAADVVVVPLLPGTPRSAGQQTYLNAMLRGQAVVATRAPGVLDYIRHNETGLVVDNEPGALTEAVNALLDDPQLRQRIGAAGRAEALAHYRTHHFHERLLGLARTIS